MLSFFAAAELFAAWPGAPEWLSTRVIVCGASAIGLGMLSLVLKGVQKVITLLIAAAIVIGAVWFVQDAWTNQILPPGLAGELNGLATRVLKHPDAKAAWKSSQAEWSRGTDSARARMAGGGDAARTAIAQWLEAKAADLRRQGKRVAAEELLRLRSKVDPRE